MGIAVDYDRLQSARDACLAQVRDRRRRRLRPAVVSLYAATSVGWEFRGRVTGMFSDSYELVRNDTGKAEIVLPGTHHLALWAARHWERDKKNVMLRMDKDGIRWCGLMENVTFEAESGGGHTASLEFMHDYEQLKKLPVWSNPMSIPEVQIPDPWAMLAPVVWNLKLLAMLNLVRAYSVLSGLPDDPLNFESWLSQWDWRRFPIIVKPGALVLDSSPFRFVSAETGQSWDEVAKPLLDDCHLSVTLDRWFPGDPDPWPGARLRMPGQIVMDIVDKSGWWEDTLTGGTIFHGAARTVLELADDGVEEVRRAVDRKSESTRYAVSGFLGVDPKVPAVSYRTTGRWATARASWSHSPATVGQVVVGGSSMPGVNETLSATTKLIFNLLGSFFLMPGFGAVADEFIGPLYRDKIMAWMALKLTLRTMQTGHGGYIGAVKGGVQAYTLPALLELRTLARETEAKTGATLAVEDAGPYLVGEHFTVGDRISYEVPVSRDGRLEFGVVEKLRLSSSASQAYSWEVTVGDWPRRDFVEHVIGEFRRVVGAAKKGGLL